MLIWFYYWEAELELFLDLSFLMQGSHRFLCISHLWSEHLTSTRKSSIHIMNKKMNTYSITCFHASLLCTISACLLEIIKDLIPKMSSARQVVFWWMTNRSVLLCVCGVIYIYFIESCFPLIWKYNISRRGGGL